MVLRLSLNELLALLMNESWHPAEHPDGARKKQNLLPVRNYLEAHYTDKKLEDIGYRCGLGAPHYFSRIFKQVEGITPSEFREKWGEAGR